LLHTFDIFQPVRAGNLPHSARTAFSAIPLQSRPLEKKGASSSVENWSTRPTSGARSHTPSTKRREYRTKSACAIYGMGVDDDVVTPRTSGRHYPSSESPDDINDVWDHSGDDETKNSDGGFGPEPEIFSSSLGQDFLNLFAQSINTQR